MAISLIVLAGSHPGVRAQAPASVQLTALAWSSDGAQIAGAQSDGTIQLWNATGTILLSTLSGHENGALVLAWDPVVGNRLASGGGDGTVRLWDTTSGDLVADFETLAESITAVAWTSDGKKLFGFGIDNETWVWDTETDELLYTFEGGGYHAALSPDGGKVAAIRQDGITLIDAHTGGFLATLVGHQGAVLALDWSPASDKFVSAGVDSTLRLWDADRHGLIRVLRGHTGFVQNVAWSPDGKWIVSESSDGITRLWNAKTGENVYTLTTNSAMMAWSPDSMKFAYGGEHGVPQIVSLVGLPGTTTP